MPFTRRSVLAALAGTALVLAGIACGDDGTADTTVETSTTIPVTTTGSTTTEPVATTATIEAVVAEIQVVLDDEFATSPRPGVIGPTEPVCTDTGPVDVGAVFACGMHTPTSPELGAVEEGNLVAYVLDASGLAAWTVAVDIPGSSERLRELHDRVPSGLHCRDLLDPEVDAYPFSQHGDGTTPAVDLFWSLVYWSLEGEPDRMDEDGDGVPCESLYEPAVVDQVLAGGRVS